MADVLAIVVLCIVPIAAIVLFWLVHILPEKIAEKRHSSAEGLDQDAVPALARLRRDALADRLALGLHQAGRLPPRLRYGQARRLFPRDGPPGEDGHALARGNRAPQGELDHSPARPRSFRRKLKALRDDLEAVLSGAPGRRREERLVMEAILLAIYSFFVWLIFIKLLLEVHDFRARERARLRLVAHLVEIVVVLVRTVGEA